MAHNRISRRGFFRKAGAGTLAYLLAANGLAEVGAGGKAPNFVFLFVDDMGWADVGCYGNTFHETPHIDRLAADGLRFTDAYAACPVCSPTRASLMTGKYTPRTGVTDWIPGNSYNDVPLECQQTQEYLSLDEVTLAEALKAGGYNTAFLGKWHLGKEKYYPTEQGFDINIAGNHKGHPHNGFFSPWNLQNLENGPKGQYLTDRLTKEAIDLLKDYRTQEAPFLLYMSYYTVHAPVQAPKEKIQKYRQKDPKGPWKNAKYAAMVEALDDNVGRLLKALERLGLAENTVVFFFSDNGGWWRATENHPLRGYKGQLYEGGIREPMIVRWPGVTEPGTVCHEPVISTDFYPTMLDIAGLDPRPEQHKDGVSLVPLLQGGGTLDRKAIYWHYPHYCLQHKGYPSGAVRKGDYKLIEFYEDRHLELYNLARDIGEKNNMAEENPEKASELARMLEKWRKEVGAFVPPRKDQE